MNVNTFHLRIQSLSQQLLDMLFPPQCPGCKRGGYILCPSCIARIQPLPSPLCQHCSTPLSPNGACKTCYYHRLNLSGLRAVGTFQEPLRASIHALKYEGNTRLAQPLGHLLAQAYTTYNISADVIVPVPLHSEREQQRGYNHAHLLARVCSSTLGIPLRAELLVRQRATAAQVDLKLSDRGVSCMQICQTNLDTDCLCRPEAVQHSQRSSRIPGSDRLRSCPRGHAGWNVPPLDQHEPHHFACMLTCIRAWGGSQGVPSPPFSHPTCS